MTKEEYDKLKQQVLDVTSLAEDVLIPVARLRNHRCAYLIEVDWHYDRVNYNYGYYDDIYADAFPISYLFDGTDGLKEEASRIEKENEYKKAQAEENSKAAQKAIEIKERETLKRLQEKYKET